MFYDWAEETTTTTGTGTLTLASISGKPRVSDVAPVDELCAYAILDGTTLNPIESGIGRVAASNTLERLLVRRTYVSGTYTGSNATAASLAAGTKRVIVTAIAGSFMGAGNAVNANATQRTIFSPHAVLSLSNTKSLGTGNECFHLPFRMDFGCDVDAFMCEVTTGAAGNLRIGLYNAAANGAPGKKILESANIDCTTTGVKTGTFTRRYLSPAWYYITIASKGVAAVVSANSAGAASNILCSTPLGYASFGVAYNWGIETLSGGWTDLPATAATSLTLGSIFADFAPQLAIRAA